MTNLPVRMDTFVGRKAELVQLDEEFEAGHRLLTLLGPGGTGKTRLAQQYGHRRLMGYSGGVWFADLTEATTALEACRIITSELKISLREEDPIAQLSEVFLERGELLLILDNLEQMVSEAGGMIALWLKEAPRARVLVTSREKLQIRDERVVPLLPLDVPEAIRLFSDRAQLADSRFRVDEDNRETVTAIVERLDRSSLAIELAAARLSVMTVEQILNRLSERFKLLRGKNRDAHSRQATLRGAIDWSWDLLNDGERIVLAQCSAFRGGFALDAAEAVVDLDALDDPPWTMDVLQSLHDKSLLQVHHPDTGGRRFRMYESIREYAREKLLKSGSVFKGGGQAARLGEDEMPTGKVALRRVLLRHAQHFAAFGDEKWLAGLDKEGGLSRQETLKLDIDNLRLAIQTALLVGKPDRAAAACIAACEIFVRSGPIHLAAELAREVLEKVDPEYPMSENLRAQLICRQARSLLFAGHQDEADAALTRAVKVATASGESSVLAQASVLHGILLWERGKLSDARRMLNEGLRIARENGFRLIEGMALGNLGMLGASDDAEMNPIDYYQASLKIYTELGNQRLMSITEGNLGLVSIEGRDFASARKYCEGALGKSQRMGARRLEGYWHGSLGQISIYQRDFPAALESLKVAVTICRDTFWKASEGRFAAMLAEVHAHQGAFEFANAEIDRAEGLLQEVGHQVELVMLKCRRGMISMLQGKEDLASVFLQQAEESLEDLEGSHPQLAYECERLTELVD